MFSVENCPKANGAQHLVHKKWRVRSASLAHDIKRILKN